MFPELLSGPTARAGFVGLVTLGLAVLTHPAPAAEKLYEWEDEDLAVDSAEAIARHCLDGNYDARTRLSCASAPLEICSAQYDDGHANQTDLNFCSGFSARAWERIVDNIFARLLAYEYAPKGIQQSQSMWKAWSDFDCRTRSDYRGSMAALEYNSCRVQHTADRVIELMSLLRL
jgi:uncharacterized protein YecT (DUF1311 family)